MKPTCAETLTVGQMQQLASQTKSHIFRVSVWMFKQLMNIWTAVNARVNADGASRWYCIHTHLRKRLSSSSRWCLSFALRLHSSSSDLLMSRFFSKWLMRSDINLDRKRQTAIVSTEKICYELRQLLFSPTSVLLFRFLLHLLTPFCCVWAFLSPSPAVLGGCAVLPSSSEWQHWNLPGRAASIRKNITSTSMCGRPI